MGLGPFPLDVVIERLKTNVPTLRVVGGAADLRAALKTAPATAPAAYVLATEQGEAPHGYLDGPLVQRVTVAVQVVVWVRHYAGAVGAAAAREMRELLTAVRAALVAWSPDSAFEPLWFQADRDESFDAGNLIAQTIFKSTYRLQAEGTP